ncbi:DUF934 domain-containing protein [Ferrovibrio sp.]|uniref:DUF934 domain-containing protein n=1 Tax=Ferrovibrio sp. TaxID=1917215 RepID=UPI00311E587C
MPLLKNGTVSEDRWTSAADDAALPADGPVLISHARWLTERAALETRNAPLGIRLPNTVDILDFGPEAGRFGLIVLEFPKFSDGRAYSQARLLRERFGYQGELRATGNILRDQLWHMHRSGFDAFELAHPDAAAALAGALGDFSAVYQPAADGRPTALQLRLQKLRKPEAAE